MTRKQRTRSDQKGGSCSAPGNEGLYTWANGSNILSIIAINAILHVQDSIFGPLFFAFRVFWSDSFRSCRFLSLVLRVAVLRFHHPPCWYCSSHLTSSDRVSTDLISSEQSMLWLVAATTNWVISQCTTQYAVAATNHSGLRWGEVWRVMSTLLYTGSHRLLTVVFQMNMEHLCRLFLHAGYQ